MHPQDVAEHVEQSVDVLRRRLEDHPDLGVSAVDLDGSTLNLSFSVTQRRLVEGVVSSGLVGANNQVFGQAVRVIDLGARPERRDLVLSLDLTDYDGQPPTAELLHPDLTSLAEAEWPKSSDFQGIIIGHIDYNRPWFCRRGLREYHSHPQHEDDPWDRYREKLALHAVVEELLWDLQNRMSFT